jgi:hypothetical protein
VVELRREMTNPVPESMLFTEILSSKIDPRQNPHKYPYVLLQVRRASISHFTCFMRAVLVFLVLDSTVAICSLYLNQEVPPATRH